MSLLKVVVLLVAAAVAATAQGPTKLVDGTGSELIVAAAGKRYESTLTVAAVTDTVVTAVTTRVQLIFCKNPEAAAQTITIKDGAGTVYFPTVAMAANSVVSLANTTVGLTLSGGVTIASSAGTAACQVVGVQ